MACGGEESVGGIVNWLVGRKLHIGLSRCRSYECEALCGLRVWIAVFGAPSIIGFVLIVICFMLAIFSILHLYHQFQLHRRYILSI